MAIYTLTGEYSGGTAVGDRERGLNSIDAAYATARTGGTITLSSIDEADVGQNTGYACWEGFLSFDTSAVVGTILSADLSLYGTALYGGAITVEVRLHDWGSEPLTIADWVSGTDLAVKPLLASRSSSGWNSAGYNAFTSEAALLANINQTGSTRMVVCSSEHRVGTVPTSVKGVSFKTAAASGTSQDPVLVIVTEDCVPPANDNWADATDLGLEPSGSIAGTTLCATNEDDFYDPSYQAVWYKWTAPSWGVLRVDLLPETPGTATFDEALLDFAPVLGTSSSLQTLGWAFDSDDSAWDAPEPWIELIVTEGRTYWIPIEINDDPGGPFTLEWALEPWEVGTSSLENGGWVAAGYAYEGFAAVCLMVSADGVAWERIHTPFDGAWSSLDWVESVGSTIIVGGWIFRQEFGASESIGLCVSTDAGRTWEFPITEMFHTGISGLAGWDPEDHEHDGEYTTWSQPGRIGNGRIVVSCEIGAGFPHDNDWFTKIISCSIDDPFTWTTAATVMDGHKFASLDNSNGALWYLDDRFFAAGYSYAGDVRSGATTSFSMSSFDGITWTVLPLPSWQDPAHSIHNVWTAGSTWVAVIRAPGNTYFTTTSTDHGQTWTGPTELLDSATSGFEDGTIGLWPATVADGFTLTNSTEYARTGSRSLKIVADTPDSGWTIATGAIDVSDVPEGKLCSCSYWYYLPEESVPGQHLVYFYIWDGATLLTMSTLGETEGVSDTWIHKTGSFEMPPNAQDLYIEMNIAGYPNPHNIGDARYFDDFSVKAQLETTDIPMTYVTDNGSRWVGSRSGKLYWSDDGLNWTEAVNPLAAEPLEDGNPVVTTDYWRSGRPRVNGVHWDGEQFWANGENTIWATSPTFHEVGPTMTVVRSDDGINWTAVDTPFDGPTLEGGWVVGVRRVEAPEVPCNPPNDNWADAEVLVGDSGSVVGTTVCATFEADEPPAYEPGDSTVWYQWTAPHSGTWTFSINPGSDPYGTWVHFEVYTGSSLASLSGPTTSGVTYLAHPEDTPVVSGETYFLRIRNASDEGTGDTGPFTLDWSFVRNPRPAEEANIVPGGRLGCSRHVAYVQNKCNGRRLCELQDASSVHYTRRLDEVSEATVVIPISGDVMSPCCSCLADVEPWCHQLTIVREGDGVVWTGPIQSIRYGRDTVTIEAQDKLAWLQFRVNECNLSYITNGPPGPGDPASPGPYKPLTEIAEEIIQLAMADSVSGDSTCFLADAQGNSLIIIPPGINGNLSDGRPPNFGRKFLFEAFAGPTAYDDLVQVANAGLDFTVINHNIILTGEDLPPRAIGILTDEMILGDVEVVKDGTSMGNRFFVRYEGDDDQAQCLAQCNAAHTPTVCVPCCTDPPVDPCYALPCPGFAEIPDADVGCYDRIERVIDGISATALDTANGVAQRYLDRGKTAPRLVELPSGTRLGPDCPWGINDMIPGQRVDVALSTLCFPVFQSFKLQSMEVTDDGTDEQISVDLVAVEQTTE